MANLEADVRRFFEEVWNQGNVVAAGDFLAAGFTSHSTAFPDLTVTLEDVFATRDRVAVRGIDRGTHHGQFMGCAATGRQVATTWIEIFRIQSGKATEGWVESDTRRLLDQIS